MSAPELSHAACLVRDFDRERFVTALFAPASVREELMVLYAFNVEIARVQESVREPMAGMIRLQWWRDALIAGAEGRSHDRHPVAQPLGAMIRSHELDLALFEDLIAAREGDLDRVQPADLNALCGYAERSSGALGRLAAQVLGGVDQDTQRAAAEVGVAWGLIGNLRALGHHLSMGKLTLPLDLMADAGMSGDDLSGHAALPEIARKIGDLARIRLDAARSCSVDRAALAAVLPALLADGHLKALDRAGWDVFHPSVAQPRTRPLRLLFGHLTGRF